MCSRPATRVASRCTVSSGSAFYNGRFRKNERPRSYGGPLRGIRYRTNGGPSDLGIPDFTPPEASHPVNAILNYAYAVLQSQVQIRLVAEGYDPMLGVMHYDRKGAPAFVFDMMEPERPKVDQAVLLFLKSEALHPADFTIREDGVIRSWRGGLLVK